MQYTIDHIEKLHRKYAPCDEVYRLVWSHSLIVHDIAMQLIEKQNLALDKDLVRIGSLLHDIGVHPLFADDGRLRVGVNYVTHGIEGEKILKEEKFPTRIWRFAANHTGVGLTRDDVVNQGLPMPVADYIAQTNEELLIMYADKFHSKTSPPYFNSYEWFRNDIAKYGDDKQAKFDAMASKFGKPDLAPLSKKYGFEIR